jgi:proteasome accessory factor B
MFASDSTDHQQVMKNMLRERYSRPPLDRMRRIHEWISSGKFPNAVTMGKDLEVTDRTVERDIEFMRD